MSARFFFLVAALALSGCRWHDKPAAQADGDAVPVHAVVATLEQLPVRQEIPATVRPAERAVIAAKLTGTVSSFPMGLGQAVAAGNVLLTLDAPEAEARLRQAQAQLAEATRTAERERVLVAKGVNAPDNQRVAEDRLHYAQAGAAEAEALLANATVRAPFAGVVTEKNVLPGDLATPSLPLLVLESTQHLRAEGTIPERAAVGLRPGDTINVVLEDGADSVAGRLEEISAAADSVSRSVLVKVGLPEGTARSGQFARLQVGNTLADALLVPVTSVTNFGQMERIFVVEQGRAVLRLVKTGRIFRDRIEVLAGLNPGEQVVLAPGPVVRDAQRVTLQP